MSHGKIVTFDMDIRSLWFPKSTLTNGMLVHGWWKRIREFELTGD